MSGRLRTRRRRRSGTRSAPSAPGTLGAVGAVGRATLSWAASTDNVGVVRYNVHRGTSAGFAVSVANRIAQPTHAGLCGYHGAGQLLLQGHCRGRGRQHQRGLERGGGDGAGGHDRAEPAGRACRLGCRQHRQPQLDCLLRQRRLSPATTSTAATSAGFTPSAAQPDRAADRGQLRRHRPGDRQLLLQGHRRGRGRQHQRRLERGNRDRRRRHPAHSAQLARRRRRRQHRQPQLGRSHRQRRRQPLQPPPRHHQRLHPQPRQPDRATDRAQLRRHRPHPRQLLLQAHRRRRRRQHRPRLQHRQRHRPRHQPAQHPHKPRRHRRRRPGQPHLDRRHRQRRRHPLQPPPLNQHRGFTPTTGNRVAQPTSTSYTDTGLAAGTYYYKLTAEDAAGNISPACNEATATVSTPPVTGLVAAYGFDTGSGTTTPDQSGTGNNGTLTNATWTHRPANTDKHSPSTAPTPPSPSPTPTASTSPPA